MRDHFLTRAWPHLIAVLVEQRQAAVLYSGASKNDHACDVTRTDVGTAAGWIRNGEECVYEY
jgi:hypothetical protein